MPITDTLDTGNADGDQFEARANWSKIFDGGTGGTEADVEISADGGGFNVELIQYPFNSGHQTAFYVRDETLPDDQYAEWEKDNDNVGGGPLIRADSNGDGYGLAHGGGIHRSLRIDAGALVTLATNLPTTAIGDVVRIDATGTTISTTIDGTPTLSNTDSIHTAGQAGKWVNGASAGNGLLLDNFECTDAAGGSPEGQANFPVDIGLDAVGSRDSNVTGDFRVDVQLAATGARDAGQGDAAVSSQSLPARRPHPQPGGGAMAALLRALRLSGRGYD